MPTLLQINTVVNRGSTGRIAEEIGLMALSHGWESYIAYGKRNPISNNKLIRIQGKWGFLWHLLMSRLFGLHGYSSKYATKRFIRKIEEIKPDIIHLHNIHGYYLHIPIFFEYLAHCGKPVVWTLHDCWIMTGHCTHFVNINCRKWETGCFNCPIYKEYPASWFWDRAKQNYAIKREIFNSVPNLHLIPVSEWLKELLKRSFLKHQDIKVINNGIDLNVYNTKKKERKDGRFKIIGVASVWTPTKGLKDFFALRDLLDENYEITLVGVNKKLMQSLPKGIKGIVRTDSVQELVNLYSESDLLFNTTYADTFPMVNIEALACGTPVLTYKTGGSPEILDEKTGIVIEQGDVQKAANMIKAIKTGKIHLSSELCRERAVKQYNKIERYKEYFQLYEDLYHNNLQK